MISREELDERLKHIGFKTHGWGRAEVKELTHIILPDEEIFECVNGIYEGGFALLVATDVRVLLIDKKPLNYLTVEDLRFDMINELDYSHRLLGAYISISAGNKNLKFRSYNQPRLRKLISHVQHCMAESKKKQSNHQEGQEQHLEQINQQLQAYLIAQYQQQQKLHEQLQAARGHPEKAAAIVEEVPQVKPSPELSDYLFAQSLMTQHQLENGQLNNANNAASVPPAPVAQPARPETAPVPQAAASIAPQLAAATVNPDLNTKVDLYKEGMQEVFGKHSKQSNTPASQSFDLEINPLRVAYSKLPQVLRSRKFGRPKFYERGSQPVQHQTEPELAS